MKKRFWYLGSILLVMLVFMTACGSNSNSSSSSLKKIQNKGTLTVGMISSNPPYEYQVNKDGKQETKGADVKLIKKIAKKLGVKYKIKTMDMDGLLPAVQSGKVDMLVTSLSPTAERKKGATFSKVYFRSTNTLVVRKSDLNKYNKNINNLSESSIAVVNNSTQQPMIEKKFPNAKLTKFSKVTDLALALNNNKVDAFSIDVPTATIPLRQNPKLAMTSWRHKDASSGAAVAMSKSTTKDLIKKVNQVVSSNKSNYEKWVQQAAKNVPTN
ncbi:transporter substrate-binding domain-containing protein [Lactobacillus halodurans]|uniref:Transporter substrate-binding domain-containing protein n=1 Tax=Companilactobacillus halodurans TaxID=2584183 RepID=A0A5P0ZP73_9LACO|nr:transporter substrate-binding domain-containing protein [Companilactobacillus halodurans]MQS76008.1 transporter substrate-binding domain-containing protein [Companilactobacillus halodurans]